MANVPDAQKYILDILKKNIWLCLWLNRSRTWGKQEQWRRRYVKKPRMTRTIK